MSKGLKQKSIGPKQKFDTFWVMINLNGPRYWKIADGIIEKSSAPSAHQGPVISFDDTSDFRVKFDKSSSVSNAKKYFLTEKQEKCRVFNGAKGVYYGTPIGRIEQFEHKLYPGAYYLDQIIENKKIEFEQDKIVGFSFESNDESSFNIIVLYSLTTGGELSQPEIALNPPDIQLVIREYAQQNGVVDTDPVLFSIDDILNNVIAGPGYPTEDMVGTVSLKSIEVFIAAALGLGVLGSGTISGYQYLASEHNLSTEKSIKTQIASKKAATDNLLRENIHAFAKLTSVDGAQTTSLSEVLWTRYSLVTTASSTRDGGLLKARIPVESVEQLATGGFVTKLNDYDVIKKTLDRTFTEGLSRGKLTLSAENNAYEIEYNFKTLDNNFISIVGRK